MKYFLFFTLLLFASCSDATMQEELTKAKTELTEANNTIDNLQEQIEPEGNLVHVVFFKLKPDADQAAFIAEVKKLKSIAVLKDLEVGLFENLGDARALSDYSMMMQMSFDDKAAYEIYQKHPIHLALRENAKPFLAGPPATYDFFKK